MGFSGGDNLALVRKATQRNRQNLLQHPWTSADRALDPEEQLATNQRQVRLASVLQALPEQDRRCLSLRAEGLTYREIAQVLEISLGSVSLSLGRSLARFARADQR
jgi:RNA polymerase sigma-70 factor (ECF subfamily)